MANDHEAKQNFEIHTRLRKAVSAWLGALFVMMPLLIVGLSFMSCESDKTVIGEKVTVGVSKSFLSIPVYIAQKQGFFSDEGLDVTLKEYPSGKMAVRALFTGEVAIATVADMPIVFNSFKRQDFCVIATFTYSFQFVRIVARKDSGIKNGAGLAGKKVGANRGTSSHFFLGVFLIHNQSSIHDVEIMNIQTVDLPAALKNKEVDAISVWQPYSQEAMDLSADNAMQLPSGEIYRTTFNLAVKKMFVKEDPETLKRFLRAIEKAAVFIRKDREKAQAIIARDFNLDKNVVSAAWDDFEFALSLDQALLVSWDNIARWAIDNGLTNKEKIPNYLNYICLDALHVVKPNSVTIIR